MDFKTFVLELNKYIYVENVVAICISYVDLEFDFFWQATALVLSKYIPKENVVAICISYVDKCDCFSYRCRYKIRCYACGTYNSHQDRIISLPRRRNGSPHYLRVTRCKKCGFNLGHIDNIQRTKLKEQKEYKKRQKEYKKRQKESKVTCTFCRKTFCDKSFLFDNHLIYHCRSCDSQFCDIYEFNFHKENCIN